MSEKKHRIYQWLIGNGMSGNPGNAMSRLACGMRFTFVSASETWKGVTCKNCLKTRRRSRATAPTRNIATVGREHRT